MSGAPGLPPNSARLKEIVARLGSAEREMLRRFYEMGQSEEQICTDLKVAAATFRALKKKVLEAYFGKERLQ